MTYLDRPVYLFAVNWSEVIERAIDYDLRATQHGFGAEYFFGTATYTANTWSFNLCLEDGADILAFENFTDASFGPLKGFWLPCPLRAARLVEAISTTQFKILAEGLADTWDSRPDQHLFFTFDDGTQEAAQIDDVADNGDGTETVTLTAALTQAPQIGTDIQRLHYVRFSDDKEHIDFDAENTGVIQQTLIELPLEYTEAETGLQPIYLYRYWMDAPVNVEWRHTSFAAAVVSNEKLFSIYPTSHGEIKKTTDMNSNPVDITVKPDDNDVHPFSMFRGMPPGKILWVEISRCQLATPDTVKKLFTGFIKSVQIGSNEWKATAASRLDWLGTKSPTYYDGTACNWDLYEPNTCKVVRAQYETTVTLAQVVDGQLPVIRVNFNFAFDTGNWQVDDWFRGGILEAGIGIRYEMRSILKSHWNDQNLELTLNAALSDFNLTDGTQYQITAGCDHTLHGAHGCSLKFNNLTNFGGCAVLLDRNLTLKGLNTNVSQGNKKS